MPSHICRESYFEFNKNTEDEINDSDILDFLGDRNMLFGFIWS